MFDECQECKKELRNDSALRGVIICKECFKKSTFKGIGKPNIMISTEKPSERIGYDNYFTQLGGKYYDKNYT